MTEHSKEVPATKKHNRKPPNAGKGRRKGAVNKTTKLLKDAILEAARAAGGGDTEGLVTYLTVQAQTNPGPFMSLLGKVLPMQVVGDGDGPIQIVVKQFSLNDSN